MIEKKAVIPEDQKVAKAFFEAQFKYCFSAWMFHSQTSNKVNLLHE